MKIYKITKKSTGITRIIKNLKEFVGIFKILGNPKEIQNVPNEGGSRGSSAGWKFRFGNQNNDFIDNRENLKNQNAIGNSWLT